MEGWPLHYALTLLLLALPLAAQVRVNSAKSVTTGTAATATINYTAASAGNLLVAMCAASNAGNPQITVLLMSGGGHTWVVDQFINDKTNGEAFSVYHAFAANTSAQTLTCTSGAPGGGNLAVAKGFVIAVLEYSGYAANYIGDGSTPFTVINKLSDSTAVSIGPIQTANANALLISAFHTDDDSADCIASVNGSWTLVQSNDDAQLSPCAGIMERIVSVTGDYSASATVATSKWVTGIMVYVPTASTPSYARTTTRQVITGANGGGNWGTSLNTSNAATTLLISANGKQYGCFAATTPGQNPPVGIALRTFEINRTTGVVSVMNPGLPGWSTSDEHNNCSIQFDKNGYAHLTYDMHVTPLIYYRSTNPYDLSAFTGPLPMLGGANETSITFGCFFKNAADGELYYTFQKGGGANGFQYFYKYNASTQTWGAPTGTTLGQIIGGTRTSFLNGLPQWYDGVLWFSFLLASADGLTVEPNQFLIGWNGTSFIKWGGSAQTIPATAANLTAVFVGGTDLLENSNGFSIDAGGRACLPMTYADGGGISQMYVACGSGGGSFTGYQLTTNTVAYKSPNPELYGRVLPMPQSPSIVALGSCTYFTYPDVFRQRGGQKIHQSCDGFATFSTYLMFTGYNPNWVFAYDQMLREQGTVSFFFQNTNDPDFQQSYLTNFSSNLGLIQVIDWVPQPASGISGNAAIRGGAILR